MPRIEATPTPSVLIWARETAGLTVESAAKRIAIKPERLLSWESGTDRPSIPQLKKIAEAYKRPLAAFYLREPPRRFEVMHDFRTLPREGLGPQRSPQLALEIRKAYDRREWALELAADLDEAIPDFTATATVHDNIEQAADNLRRAIHVNFEMQTGWRSAREAFNGWRGATEDAGLLTLQATSLSLDEARGFSISMKPLPVVVVNIKDALRGRVFTLLHEVAHVMLNEGGICDLHDADTEAYCNRLAGAALFPQRELLQSPTVLAHRIGEMSWSDAELKELSRQFGGSREAALVRLLTLKLTSQDFYRRMRKKFLQEYQDLQKQKEQSEGFPPPHVIALSSAGPMFTNLVLENLNREKITTSEVSDLLQIRAKHVRELLSELSKGA